MGKGKKKRAESGERKAAARGGEPIALATMQDVFAECANTIQWRYDAFMANPDDAEALHKFRVSLRTARSLAGFARPWVKGKRLAQLDEAMRKVVGKTSRLRELDVICDQVKEDHASDAELVGLCARATREERDAVVAALSSGKARKRLAFAVESLHEPAWKKSALDSLDDKAVRRRFAELHKAVAAELKQLDYADYAPVHQARKDVKQVRYVAERFADLLGDDARSAASEMKAEQDRLGKFCDAYASLALIEALASRDDAQAASRGLEELLGKYRSVLA